MARGTENEFGLLGDAPHEHRSDRLPTAFSQLDDNVCTDLTYMLCGAVYAALCTLQQEKAQKIVEFPAK
jgi:hypothetical protein